MRIDISLLTLHGDTSAIRFFIWKLALTLALFRNRDYRLHRSLLRRRLVRLGSLRHLGVAFYHRRLSRIVLRIFPRQLRSRSGAA